MASAHRIPARLGWLAQRADGRAWLAALPELVSSCAARWSLRLGEPFPDSLVALVVPCTGDAGREMVLKIQFPHRESEHEATALERWNGDGAVLLLDRDAEAHALLVERCMPGTHLRAVGRDVALDVLVGLLPRLLVAAGAPFRSATEEAAMWEAQLPKRWEQLGRPFPRRLLDEALDLLRTLPGSQGDAVLVHQDLHADNVLRAQREPWLVIDPKPLAAERELAAAPIVRAYELGHSRDDVWWRLDRLSVDLGLDRERARGWALAQTLAWSLDGSAVGRRHVETATWLADPPPTR